MKTIRALFLTVSVITAVPAFAGPDADALASCLADHTTGKDRKGLARWVFLAMAAHPELKDVSASTDTAKLDADKFMGQLVTKLMSEDCTKEAKAAMQTEGAGAMQFAFGSLGRVAMQELMSNPAVTKSISAFEVYLDQAKLRSSFAQ